MTLSCHSWALGTVANVRISQKDIRIMVEGFLGTLRPVFGFARLVGLFPCKRVRKENGHIELVPISWKIQLTLYMISYTLFLGPYHILWPYFIINKGKSFRELCQCFMNLFYGNETVVDAFIIALFFTFVSASTLLICIGNYKMKQELCELSVQYSQRKSKKKFKSFYFLLSMISIWSVGLSVNSAWMNYECLSMKLVESIVLSVFLVLGNIWTLMPWMIFYGISMELLSDLEMEAENIIYRLKSSILPNVKIKQCEQFEIYAIKVKKILSRNILYSMTSLAVEILILLFAIPSIIINMLDNEDYHPGAILNAATTSLYISTLFMFVFYLNITAENVTNKVLELNFALKDVYVPIEVLTKDTEGNTAPLYFVKSRVEDKLDRFQGFDGQGYFVLG